MRKLKIILPSIALIVVLSLSITIGVYAASSATFNISSTISFNSPNIENLVVDCYVKQGNNEKSLWFTYSSDKSVESDGNTWDLKNHKSGKNESMSFESRDSNNNYAPITLIFNIKHTSALPLYAYFTVKDASEGISSRVVSQQINGVKQPSQKLVDATFNDDIYLGIAGKQEGQQDYVGGEVSILLELEPDSTLITDTINFNYDLVITKVKMFTNQTADTTNNNVTLNNPNLIKDFVVTGNSTQSQETPAPSSPQEIVSVGDRTRNLFDINSGFATNATYSQTMISGNRITIPYSSGNSFSAEFKQYIEIEQGQTYFCSYNVKLIGLL